MSLYVQVPIGIEEYPRQSFRVALKDLPVAEELARLIGQRIDEAWPRAGFHSRAEMIRASGVKDSNQAHKWALGKNLPRVDGLAAIAQTCKVSIDWLVFGFEETPPAYWTWAESASGSAAPEDARRFLRALPLKGYKASPAFYDLAFQAWKLGLATSLTADETVQMLTDTDTNS